MDNRIILSTITPLLTSYEKEHLHHLGFDMTTLEEKGDVTSIILPPHLKQEAPRDSITLFGRNISPKHFGHNIISYNGTVVMSICNTSSNINQETVMVLFHSKGISEALNEMRKASNPSPTVTEISTSRSSPFRIFLETPSPFSAETPTPADDDSSNDLEEKSKNLSTFSSSPPQFK